MTLADTVEFFNLVLGLKLTQEEKDVARRLHAGALNGAQSKTDIGEKDMRAFAIGAACAVLVFSTRARADR